MKKAISPIAVSLLVIAMFALAGCSGEPKFAPEDIHAIAKLGVDQSPEEAIQTIHQALMEKYPDLIRKDLKWHFNRTGGTLGQMALLYASTTEYVLIFGTPIGSEGFSGRYQQMDVYDCMFAGEMWTYTEGQIEKTVYLPGDCAVLQRGEGKGYYMAADTWMLEYSRGNIPAALPIGAFAPTTLTRDFETMFNVVLDYAGLVIRSMFGIKP